MKEKMFEILILVLSDGATVFEEVQWVTRQNRGWEKAKMLSKFPDHPEVQWEEREPIANTPTLDVESDREGEEETCAANTGDNIRNPSVSTIPIHDFEGNESVKWDDPVDALLLETEPDIPPQRGELGDQAKCLLAFACMAADKTTRSEERDPQWTKPSKDSCAIGEHENEDLKQLLFHRVEHLHGYQKRGQWREKRLQLKMKRGTSVYVPEYDDDPSACTCEYQGLWGMLHMCQCHQASTLTLRKVRELLREYGDESVKDLGRSSQRRPLRKKKPSGTPVTLPWPSFHRES